jgi:hypothetical protein
MSFPFLWIGIIVAGTFLAAVLTVFGIAVELVARVTHEVRGSVLPGLVAGFREWADDGVAPARRASTPASAPPEHPAAAPPESPFEDLATREVPAAGRVRGHVGRPLHLSSARS